MRPVTPPVTVGHEVDKLHVAVVSPAVMSFICCSATVLPWANCLTSNSTGAFRLQHQFSGVTEQETAYVWQLALRVSAARLCAAAGAPQPPAAPGAAASAGASAAALSAAAALTHHAELLDRLLASAGRLFESCLDVYAVDL